MACDRWRAALGAAALTVGVVAAAPAVAQDAAATARALKARYAGSDDSEALLREPAVRTQLQKLLGAQSAQLRRNLDVRGEIDLVGGALSVSGNAVHGGGEEEAVVCVLPHGPKVQAAINSRGRITVFAAEPTYEYLSLCIKDWITQVNSKHVDRFRQPRNVRVVGAP
jgi:hypothetical protein